VPEKEKRASAWRGALRNWRQARRERRTERVRLGTEHQRGREREGKVGKGGRDAGDGFTIGF
jgi:hypothetical protein